jgi:hypothetical protein
MKMEHNEESSPKVGSDFGEMAIMRLETIAWVTLIFGIVGAIITFGAIGYVQNPEYKYATDNILNIQGIIIAVSILFSSIIISSFLFVFCGIAKNILDMRKKSE